MIEETPDKATTLPSCFKKAGFRFALIAAYFGILPAFILALVALQLFISHQKPGFKSFSFNKEPVEYKAIPEVLGESVTSIAPKEARVDILMEFLGRYKSPLEPYSKLIVDTADKYEVDYRLLPAIAMQESTLCKKIPKDSYNCWGFGIYGKKVTRFKNFDEAIETITKTLARDYHGRGLVEPEEIMSRYTPSNKGEWAQNVSYIMRKLELPE